MHMLAQCALAKQSLSALCNWTLADYTAATSTTALPASKIVFMEVDVAAGEWLAEAQWVQGLADGQGAGQPTIGAIVVQPPPG